MSGVTHSPKTIPLERSPVLDSVLAHRVEVEESILGACVANQAWIEHAGQRLTPDAFSSPARRDLWRVLRDMHLAGEAVDAPSVAQRMPDRDGSDYLLRRAWLLDLSTTALVSNTKQKVAQLRDHVMRGLVEEAIRESADALGDGLDWRKGVEALEQAAVRLSLEARGLSDEDADETTKGQHGMRLLEWFFEQGGVGYPLPWRLLQEAYQGIQKRKLVTVCGYSSDGKSVALMQIADSALRSGAKVWYVSLEMPVEEVLGRWAAQREVVSYPRLAQRDPECKDALPYFNIDNEDLRVTGRSITPSKVRAIQMRERFDVIVFDHLHRLSSRMDVLEDAVRQFKNIALDLDCCVVLGAQLSRREDTRPEPNLNMIRGTAGIEHESDLVLSVWRERHPNQSPDDPLDTGKIRALKARGGRRGIVQPVVFHPKNMRFNER